MRKFFAEPLLHFFILALAFFLLYQNISPDLGTERRIIVTNDNIQLLAQRFRATWQRLPTPEELSALTENYIKEEILYRQGVSMGLDRNDQVIKRRVLQKLEVLSEETSTPSPPTETELNTYLNAHAERYAFQPEFTLQQVLFDPLRHPKLETDLKLALKKLNAGADVTTLGDSTLLPTKLDAVGLDRLARDFGEAFATAINTLQVGSWQGPVRSSFGMHLVRIDKKVAGRPASLAEVRDAVERDWENERRTKARDDYYQNLRKAYVIEIETPDLKIAP